MKKYLENTFATYKDKQNLCLDINHLIKQLRMESLKLNDSLHTRGELSLLADYTQELKEDVKILVQTIKIDELIKELKRINVEQNNCEIDKTIEVLKNEKIKLKRNLCNKEALY
jgi:hypothetical protein